MGKGGVHIPCPNAEIIQCEIGVSLSVLILRREDVSGGRCTPNSDVFA